MRTLIVGCGYVGLALGKELARQGHEVFGLRRDSAAQDRLLEAGIRPLIADITKPDTLAALPGAWDWVVHCVSSGKGGAAEYRQIYLAGTANVLDWLAVRPPKKFVYTSSTSAYGQADGSAVKESSPTEPASETSQVLVEAEQQLLRAAPRIPIVILRVAGIYGPGRCYLLQQYLKNELRIEAKGERFLNMIHLDDLVAVIGAVLKNGHPGEIYNAVDDEPVAEIHFVRWLSETLGKWMPPFASEPEPGGRKRGWTSKKVLNRRLKMELGFQFKHPTFRQGYTEEIRRLDEAGQLEIPPEPR